MNQSPSATTKSIDEETCVIPFSLVDGVPPAHFSFLLFEYQLRIVKRKQMHDTGDRAGPSRLMARADPGAGVPVQVLIEQGIISPIGIFLKFS